MYVYVVLYYSRDAINCNETDFEKKNFNRDFTILVKGIAHQINVT